MINIFLHMQEKLDMNYLAGLMVMALNISLIIKKDNFSFLLKLN